MTIPIQPGPFSFLEDVGGALGEVGQLREKRRQQQVKEATDVLNQMIELRQKGFLQPDAFASPQAMNVYKTLGIMPTSNQPTSGEQVEAMKGQYLRDVQAPQIPVPSLGGGAPAMVSPADRYSDEMRAIMGAPSRALTPKTEAEIAGAQAAVPQAQLAGVQAQAQIPGAPLTAQTGQVGQQQKPVEAITDDWITGQYAVTKKLPASGADAYAAALADPRISEIAKQVGQRPFDAAIERLRQRLYALATERTAAAARYKGAAGTGIDDIAKIYQAQQTRLTAELNALDKPTPVQESMAAIAQDYRTRGKAVPTMMQMAERKVTEYQKRRGEIEQQLQQIGNQVTQTMGPLMGAPGPNPPGQSGSPQQRAAAQEYEAKAKGITDPARRKAIANEIAKKYGINL